MSVRLAELVYTYIFFLFVFSLYSIIGNLRFLFWLAGDGSQTEEEDEDGEEENCNKLRSANQEEMEEKEKTDQSQQTTPTSPPPTDSGNLYRFYLLYSHPC